MVFGGGGGGGGGGRPRRRGPRGSRIGSIRFDAERSKAGGGVQLQQRVCCLPRPAVTRTYAAMQRGTQAGDAVETATERAVQVAGAGELVGARAGRRRKVNN